MKKHWIIPLIFVVICGSTFANTEIYSLGVSILTIRNIPDEYELVETGLLGLLAWLAVLVIFYAKAIMLFVKKQADRNIIAAAVAGATVLIVHSFIEIENSHPFLLIKLLFILIPFHTY